ncbi:MAG: hypothetical protein P0107_05240 [Nitrosomonas sp.]|nr:hypothetical protein [Nitrosomonas sp.]
MSQSNVDISRQDILKARKFPTPHPQISQPVHELPQLDIRNRLSMSVWFLSIAKAGRSSPNARASNISGKQPELILIPEIGSRSRVRNKMAVIIDPGCIQRLSVSCYSDTETAAEGQQPVTAQMDTSDRSKIFIVARLFKIAEIKIESRGRRQSRRWQRINLRLFPPATINQIQQREIPGPHWRLDKNTGTRRRRNRGALTSRPELPRKTAPAGK